MWKGSRRNRHWLSPRTVPQVGGTLQAWRACTDSLHAFLNDDLHDDGVRFQHWKRPRSTGEVTVSWSGLSMKLSPPRMCDDDGAPTNLLASPALPHPHVRWGHYKAERQMQECPDRISCPGILNAESAIDAAHEIPLTGLTVRTIYAAHIT